MLQLLVKCSEYLSLIDPLLYISFGNGGNHQHVPYPQTLLHQLCASTCILDWSISKCRLAWNSPQQNKYLGDSWGHTCIGLTSTFAPQMSMFSVLTKVSSSSKFVYIVWLKTFVYFCLKRKMWYPWNCSNFKMPLQKFLICMCSFIWIKLYNSWKVISPKSPNLIHLEDKTWTGCWSTQ